MEQHGELSVAVQPWVGVWRVTWSDPNAEVPPFGRHRLPVWGLEIQPDGRFHLLHEGNDGSPIRQAGFDVEGSLSAGSDDIGTILNFHWPGNRIQPTRLTQISADEIELTVDSAIRKFRMGRWSGQAFCAGAVPPKGTLSGAAGCNTPEYGIVDAFQTEADLSKRLVGRWVVCTSTVNGSGVTHATPAGLDIADDLQVWELWPNKGELVRGAPIGRLEIKATDTGWTVGLMKWSWGPVFFSDAPVKMQWLTYEFTHMLSRLP